MFVVLSKKGGPVIKCNEGETIVKKGVHTVKGGEGGVYSDSPLINNPKHPFLSPVSNRS